MNETTLMRMVKHELNVTQRCRLLRNNVGLDKEKGVLFGLGTGSADLVGVLANGQCLAMEAKAPGSKVGTGIRPAQYAWWKSAYKWGVRGGIFRSLEGAFRLLEDAERGPMGPEIVDYE